MFCMFCNKQCKNNNSLRNHERLCGLNPNKQVAKIEDARKKAISKVECKYCNNTFSLNGLGKHQIACLSNPSVIEKKSKVCPVCDSTFFSKSVTCSYSCSNTYFSYLRNKPEKYNSYRTICWKEHKKECVVCGENKIVAVHHMNENHEDNSIGNLVPLCPTHHSYMHSKYKSEILHKVEEYVKQFNLRFA